MSQTKSASWHQPNLTGFESAAESASDWEAENALSFLETKSAVKFYAEKCWRLPEPLVQQFFPTYYLLYWQGSYIIKNMVAGIIHGEESITRNHIKFHVYFSKGLTRGKILRYDSQQYALSFRIPARVFNLPPIVIISESR